MNRQIIQIYEVQTPDEAEKLIEIGIDHIGSVILSSDTWKDREIKETVNLVKSASFKSSLIPLFSDIDTISNMLDFYQPDIVHFCEALINGNVNGLMKENVMPENVIRHCEYLSENQEKIKKRFPDVNIMRSIPIPISGKAGTYPIFDFVKIFEPTSDFFLTDTLLLNTLQEGEDTSELQPVNGFVGITGLTCDWDVAKKMVEKSKIPVILAGGINPDNVYDGISHVKPHGVDSCTGTNKVDEKGQSIRFKKDFEKVKKLVKFVRKAES